MPDNTRRRAVVDLIFPALLITLQLFLFGPHTIYSGNEAEFTASFWALERHLLLPAALIFSASWSPGRHSVRHLASRVRRASVRHRHCLVDSGKSAGRRLRSTRRQHDRLEPACLEEQVRDRFLGGRSGTRSARFQEPIAPVAPFASGVFVALQAALLIASAVQADPGTAAAWRGPSDAMFEVSRKQNAFHIVLDGFHSDVFAEILEAERPLMDRDFSGFVFFEDHAGAFSTTMVSVPAMLTGTVYRQEEPLQNYLRNHFKKGSIFNTLPRARLSRRQRHRNVLRQSVGHELLSHASAICQSRGVHEFCRLAACRSFSVQARAARPALMGPQQPGVALAKHVRSELRQRIFRRGVITP